MFLVMVSWGGSWINAKVLVRYAAPEQLIFWRFALTTLTLIPVMIVLRESFRFRRTGFFAALLGAVILLVYNLFFFMGLNKGLASIGGVLTTTLIPAVTYLINKLISRGEFLVKDIIGLCIGAVGAGFILRIWEMDWYALFHSGNVFFLLAAVTWAVLTNLSARVKTILSPIGFNFYLSLFTTIFIFVYMKGDVGSMASFDGLFWLNLFLLAAFATTFGSSVYFICASKLGSDKASSFVFLVPVSALIFSMVFLGEKVAWSTFTGGAIALCAVYLINKKAKAT
ncbi:DMT family transporter [Geovibrio thiophilus]|nr:DMT family transporter [Geovibrio thiophilus]